jgi:hypothetical protein
MKSILFLGAGLVVGYFAYNAFFSKPLAVASSHQTPASPVTPPNTIMPVVPQAQTSATPTSI